MTDHLKHGLTENKLDRTGSILNGNIVLSVPIQPVFDPGTSLLCYATGGLKIVSHCIHQRGIKIRFHVCTDRFACRRVVWLRLRGAVRFGTTSSSVVYCSFLFVNPVGRVCPQQVMKATNFGTIASCSWSQTVQIFKSYGGGSIDEATNITIRVARSKYWIYGSGSYPTVDRPL